MSTPPSDLSFYKITQTSAFLQWYSDGSDTNYADIICYATSDLNKVVFSSRNIHTPNTQYYSSQITGLIPGKTYICYIHTKLDQSGTGESALVRSPEFTTLATASSNPATDPLIQQLIYVATNIGGFFFDAFLQIDHESSLTITSHPVETGASISDHAFVNPALLTMQIGMSDAAEALSVDQFTQGPTRSVTAYQVLLELQRLRIPMQVMTRLKIYKNMLIETISVPDDYTTVYGLKATVVMKEVLVATVQTVKISARPHVTDSTNRGVVDPQIPNQSVAFQLVGELLGGNGGMINS